MRLSWQSVPCPALPYPTLLAVIVTQPEKLSENGLGPGLAGAIKLRACSVARPSPLVLCPAVFHIPFPAWKTYWEPRPRCSKGAGDLPGPGKDRRGNLVFLQHLLGNGLTHPLCLVQEGQ